MSTRKKKPKIDISRLDAAQLEFIQRRVVELGSIAEVERAYPMKDSVCEFARFVAWALYGVGSEV